MITPNPQVAETIYDIYRDNYGIVDEQINPIDLIRLARIMNTYNVDKICLRTSILYWNFLNAVLDSIDSGYWTSQPFSWFETICANKHKVLTDIQIQTFYTLYLKKREKLCVKLGISPGEAFDKHLLLHWVRQSKGELFMIQVANVIMRCYLFYEKVELPFIMNNAALANKSFSNANQNIWPLKGNTKDQVLAMNFKYPYPLHEKFI